MNQTWQLNLLQIINGQLPTGSTNFNHDGVEVTSGKGQHQKFTSSHDFSVYAYVATLTVAALAVGICMQYLGISGEDLSTYLLVFDKSCFVP